MKKIKKTLVFGVVAAVGIFVTGFNVDSNKEMVDNSKQVIKESIASADETKKDLLNAILSKNKKAEISYLDVRNDDESIVYTSISGYDLDKDIAIDGRIYNDGTGSVFLHRGDYSVTLDFTKGLYYEDYYKGSEKYHNDLTRSEIEVLAFLECERSVEKTDDGYIAKIDDGLNFGYDLYDLEGNLYESHLENSQGKFVTKLLKTNEDVESIYNEFLSMKDSLEKTENISDIK